MNITREIYTMVDYASTKLVNYYRQLSQNREILSRVRQICPGPGSDEDSLKFIVLLDVLKCYDDLKYQKDVNAPEGLGLFMLCLDLGENSASERSYNMLSDYYAVGAEACNDIIKALDEQLLLVPSGTTLLGSLVEQVDPELAKEYHILLYRFMSVVVKSDYTVDATESEYLAKMLSRTENKPNATEQPKETTAEQQSKEPIVNRQTAESVLDASKDNNIVNSIDDLPAMKELNALVGLDSVKHELKELASFALVRGMRQRQGLNVPPLSMHCIFTGNPGTGKTTVARILAQIYHHLGLIKTDKLVETDRSGLVAEYIGQTAVKTNKIIDNALDGLLFIDEAYSLISHDGRDYGKEAITTMIKRMEDDRDRLIIILAGYPDDMQQFLQQNPGLSSRFGRTIKFENYSSEELYQILEFNLRKYDYTLSADAVEPMKKIFAEAAAGADKSFGNARYVRNVFEQLLQNQANRVAFLPSITPEMLSTITLADVEQL